MIEKQSSLSGCQEGWGGGWREISSMYTGPPIVIKNPLHYIPIPVVKNLK